MQTNLPHYREPWFLRRAVQRYLRLLYLHDKNPDKFLVPAYDMDLVWHAHMVRPALDTLNLHPGRGEEEL